MGTIDYMAPEQAFNNRTADARADIYSPGCTLWRMLTGQNLFTGERRQYKPLTAYFTPAQQAEILRRAKEKLLANRAERAAGRRPPSSGQQAKSPPRPRGN